MLYTWSAQKEASPILILSGKGACFRVAAGAQWFDFESQIFNYNLGHGVIDSMHT